MDGNTGTARVIHLHAPVLLCSSPLNLHYVFTVKRKGVGPSGKHVYRVTYALFHPVYGGPLSKSSTVS